MIHKYAMGGYRICLDTHSGAVHLLDALSYDLLDFTGEEMTAACPEDAYAVLKDYTKAEIDECYAELFALHEGGVLHSPDTYEPLAAHMGAAPVKSMCLNIAHDCNLRCEYCFAAKGDFGQGRKLMSFDTAKKAIDFLIEKSAGRRQIWSWISSAESR